MSHIDSFKHELVGLFGGLPVYHPLEDIKGDFTCNEEQLLLGGGSGEHPALVIKDPLAAVAWFLHEELASLDNDDIKPHEYPLKKHVAEWKLVINDHLKWDYKDHLEFCEWSVSDYRSFYERCSSCAMPNQYDDESDISFEEWLILGIGEFVFFAMPTLAEEIMKKLKKPYEYFYHMQYNNILAVPKNFPVYAVGGNAFKYV